MKGQNEFNSQSPVATFLESWIIKNPREGVLTWKGNIYTMSIYQLGLV